MENKQLKVHQKTIGEYTFFIKFFPALKSANISGKLASIIGPILGCIIPMLGDDNFSVDENGNVNTEDIMDMDMGKAAPFVSQAFSSLSGDQIEMLCKELLIDHDNITVRGPATDGECVRLDEDLVNEIFCGEILDLYMLCFEVIKLNFKGFFRKLGLQSGSLQGTLAKLTQKKSENTETSIPLNSETSN